MIFFDNGIIIQATNREDDWYRNNTPPIESPFYREYTSYKGVGRYLSWPLEIENDNLSKELTIEANEQWFNYFYGVNNEKYMLRSIPNKEFCIKYLKHCHNKNIDTRILFCKTEREIPIWETEIPDMEFLGYDFATSSDFYSSIPDDLLLKPDIKYINVPVYFSFINCSQFLNQDKLFANEEDVKTYIDKRNRVLASEIEWTSSPDLVPMHLVEPDDDFCIFQLSEIVRDF